jgi:predicted dehydrogenase
MSAPRIRIGFIGASVEALAWSTGTHIPYLLSPAGQEKYEIVALCNSSIASGKAAVSARGLAPNTRVYEDPSVLAADPDVDLVVCSVNVAKHYELIKPALEAGKMVYVEWPLGANLSEAEELAKIAQEKGVKTVVGLQGRMEPLIDTIRSVVNSGKIGDVLSSTIVAAAGNIDRQEKERVLYLLDSKSGGSVASIHFGHCG